MRVTVGDMVSYEFGSVSIDGIVIEVSTDAVESWGWRHRPEFAMKLLEFDGEISEWDVWPRDVIVIHSEKG